MGTAKVSDSSSGNQNARNESETDVILNVYDLTPYNNYTYWVGFGIYHSGIEAPYCFEMVDLVSPNRKQIR
ncbi:hypothetical protein V6N12_075254, partial [Hibiscus sabdariffa]